MRKAIVFVLSMTVFSASAHAQSATNVWDPAGLQLSRLELEEMLARFEETASQGAYSRALRSSAESEAELIRQRLREGDLRAGDRVVLVVEGFVELSDTFNVGANRSITLPEIGEVTVSGVLRSELQGHLSAYIGRFIHNPVVHARSLVRLEVVGGVLRPGFYTIPSDILVSDALMLAGGPLPNAQIDKISIRRGSEEIWSGERMRDAVIEGRTLDQLSIRAGDGIHVPSESNRGEFVRNGALILTGLISVVGLAFQIGAF